MTTRRVPDDEVFATAEAQRGVIARYQLLRSHPESEADDLLRVGWFVRLSRGSYRLRGIELPEQLAFAAALRSRPSATITGPLALGLIGVPGFSTASAFEILVRPGRHLSGVDFLHRVDPLTKRAVTRYGDVQVAGPLDALIDTAGFLERGIAERDLRVAWDHVRGKRLSTPDRLRRRIDLLRDLAPGAAILEQVLMAGGGLEVESEGERTLYPFVSCFEPAFVPQVWVTRCRRVDFFSHRCRYGCEYVGDVDHAYVAQRIADDERDAELRREGIRIRYVTKHDLREPAALVATLAAALTVRAHELGVVPPVVARPFLGA